MLCKKKFQFQPDQPIICHLQGWEKNTPAFFKVFVIINFVSNLSTGKRGFNRANKLASEDMFYWILKLIFNLLGESSKMWRFQTRLPVFFFFLFYRLLGRVGCMTRRRRSHCALDRHEGVNVPKCRRVFEGSLVSRRGRAFSWKGCSSFPEKGRRIRFNPAVELMEILAKQTMAIISIISIFIFRYLKCWLDCILQ